MLCKNLQISDTALLSTYIIDDSQEYFHQAPRPAVLVLPGGGYMFTADREAEFIALGFSAKGYHAFVLRYAVGAKAVFPTPMVDGFKALLEIRKNAEEWRVDKDKIALCGFSAGGHLASYLMTQWHNTAYSEKLGVKSELLQHN